MRIHCWKSPRIFSPIFRWIFWRQLARNKRCKGRNRFDNDCY